ncbi:MAG: PKD domain-containing protein [Flavobacteriales bacterium]|nr:PKD domain-containing protein [Flavobacteriales bacterium]
MRLFSAHHGSIKACLCSFQGILLVLMLSVGDVWAQVDTEFWFAAPEVSQDGSNFDRPITLRITTLGQASTVTVTQPANGGFVPIAINVAANASANIDLTPFINTIENKPANAVLNFGLHITATAPVSIYYEVVSQQCLCNPEIFALKGMNAVGNGFIVPFQTFLNNGGGYAPTPYSSFDIVATENTTTVTITPTQAIVGHPAGVPFTFNLDQGQTWSGTASSQAAAQHPSGTVVTSDRPIAITIKDDLLSGAPYGGCADLMGDQIVPIDKVGEEYIVMKGGLNGPDRVFIVGTQNGTTVAVAGAGAGTINAGQTLTVDITAASTYIVASAPVYVLHLSGFGCEVGGALLPPIICTGSAQLGFTRSTNENFAVNLMTRTGNEGGFTINGNAGLVPAGAFQPVPNTNGDWMAAQIYFTVGQIAAGSGNIIANSLGKFHMGIIHGSGGGGTRYGYFSDFNALDPPIVASSVNACTGGEILLSASSDPGATFDWTGPNGFTSTVQNPVIMNAAFIHQGIYTVIAELDGCVSDSAHVPVTVEDCGCVETVSNGGFEQPVASACWDVFNQAQVPEWRTLSAMNIMEIWNGACMGVPAYEGAQMAEMDAGIAPYFMDVCTDCAEIVNWGLAHRGRMGVDVMGLEAGPPGGPYVPLGAFTDSNNAWGYYTGVYNVPAGQAMTRFLLTSISASGGNSSIGNLVDAVTFVQAVIPINVSALICDGGSYLLPGGTTVAVPGVYTDTLVSSAGCDSVIVTTLAFHPQPVANAGQDAAVCAGESVQLNGSGGVAYAWTPVPTLSDPATANPTATPASTTAYTLTVTDANGCEDNGTVTVTVNPLPSVNAGTDASVCIGTTAQLGASGADSYDWSPAAGLDDAAISDPTFSGLATQTFTVTGTDANGCQNTDDVTVTVVDLPSVNAGNDTAICIGSTLQLNATGGVSYVWDPATDLNNVNIANPIFSGIQTTAFTVTGTDAAGCVNTDDITITVNSLPIINAGNDAEICAGQTAQLNASGAQSYVWSPASGLNDAAIATPTFSGTNSTIFTVSGTDANGCQNTDDVIITVNPLPIADIDPPADVCLGNATQFTHSSTGSITGFNWVLAAGVTPTIENPSHTYASDGTFNVSLTVTDINGCVDSDNASATVLPLPQPDMNIQNAANFCENETIQFNALNVAGAAAFAWNFNYQPGLPPQPDFSSSQQNPSFTYNQFGSYNVRLLVLSQGGCVGDVVRSVNVHDVPVADFSFNVACEGESTLLNSLSTVQGNTVVNGWQWNMADGSPIQYGEMYVHQYATAGTYTVQHIIQTNQGCRDTIVQDVWMNPTPVMDFSGNNVCLEDETVFGNNSTPQDATIIAWEWDFGDAQTMQTLDASHTYAAFGTYSVTLTAESDSGCSATGIIQVDVYPNPVPVITVLVPEGCEPLTVPMLSNSSIPQGSIVTHDWDFGDGNLGNGASLTHVYQDTLGTFDLTLTVTSNQGCVSTMTATGAVTVNVTPVADFGQNAITLSMLDPLLVLTDLSQDALLHGWTFGDGSTSALPSPQHRYSDPGEYDITLTVRNGDCMDTRQSKIIVEPLFTFYIPNAFTPDANNRNERFFAQGEGYEFYEMVIYDRWGEVIYQGVDAADGWDGSCKGKQVPLGAYIYNITVKDLTGEVHEFTGKVMLVR